MVFTHTYNSSGICDVVCTVEDESGAETNSFSLVIKIHSEIHVPSEYYSTIQDAIDASLDGDLIMVADGTYQGDGNREIDFKGKAITVQSENGPENCIIDCEYQTTGFYLHSFEENDSVISGFTITHGKFFHGGGIYCYDSSPTISGCIIKENTTSFTSGDYYGGGIYCFAYLMEQMNPIITNCVIVNNHSGRRGGGIYISDFVNTTISSCTVSNNSTSTAFDASGGGIYSSMSNVSINNCILWGNYPDDGCGGNITYSNVQQGCAEEGNITLDPLFRDITNGDYSLKDNSICIGSGTSEGAPNTDLERNVRPNPYGSKPDMGAYENILGEPEGPPLDIFGMSVNNQWTYEGIRENEALTIEREITTMYSSPVPTYVFEIKENGNFVGTEQYEHMGNELYLKGGTYEDEGSFYTLVFSEGLKAAWYPMAVNDHEFSSTTTEFEGYTFEG